MSSQTPLSLAALIVGVAFGATVRVLPKDLDLTDVVTFAAVGAGLGGFIAYLAGEDWRRGAELGARWGAVMGLAYFLFALVTGIH
jgi:hypothetical protein